MLFPLAIKVTSQKPFPCAIGLENQSGDPESKKIVRNRFKSCHWWEQWKTFKILLCFEKWHTLTVCILQLEKTEAQIIEITGPSTSMSLWQTKDYNLHLWHLIQCSFHFFLLLHKAWGLRDTHIIHWELLKDVILKSFKNEEAHPSGFSQGRYNVANFTLLGFITASLQE